MTVTLASLGPMRGSGPSTVMACSGRLEKSCRQVAIPSELDWSEMTLSISASAGTNPVHRSLMALYIAELTRGLTQMSGYGSTANYTAQQVSAEIGGVNVSITCVAIS